MSSALLPYAFLTKTSSKQQVSYACLGERQLCTYIIYPKSLSFHSFLKSQKRPLTIGVKCQQSGSLNLNGNGALKIGSPVVLVDSPPFVKTAEPMPMLKPNDGLLNVGDPGRVIDKKPKGVWAVRFSKGAFLVDEKYFRVLEAE